MQSIQLKLTYHTCALAMAVPTKCLFCVRVLIRDAPDKPENWRHFRTTTAPHHGWFRSKSDCEDFIRDQMPRHIDKYSFWQIEEYEVTAEEFAKLLSQLHFVQHE